MIRRNFISSLASAYLGTLALPSLAASKPSGNKIIYIFMSGGLSHVDTFDPKTTEVAGDTKILDTNADDIKLGHNLVELSKISDKMAVVRSTQTQTGDHRGGKYVMRTSYRQGSIVHPSLGSWKARNSENKSAIPNFVSINEESDHPKNGFLPSRYAPLPIGNPDKAKEQFKILWQSSKLDSRMQALNDINRRITKNFKSQTIENSVEFYDEAIKTLKSKDLDVFDISKESKETREKYGMGQFGQGLLLARRLVENGCDFIEVTKGGWDTHTNNFNQMDQKLPEIDKGISALVYDLENKGLLKSTTIVIATEFGRTPNINQNNGRDHHPQAFSTVFIGGGVKGGTVYGSTDKNAKTVVENPTTVQDINATVSKLMGIGTEEKFHSSSGRPFTTSNKGKVIENILT